MNLNLAMGLGNNFEIFNAKWLEKFLSINHPNIQIEINKIFKIISLICECTTFLKADEISKVEKLLKIKSYFENQTKQVKYIYFITYDIDEKIK